MSVARKILRDKEAQGIIVPYIRESGFVVYTTPSELKKREMGAPVMLTDALEEVASSVPDNSVITDEMDVALAAAATPGAVKPSKLARKRREAGEKKERRDKRPEVIVEPLVEAKPPAPEPTPEPEAPKKPKKTAKKKTEEKPKKAKPKAKAMKAEPKPKKAEEKAKKSEPKTKAKKEEPKPEKASPRPARAAKPKKPELTDIDGVGPKTAEALKEGGFKTVAALSKASVDKLSKKIDGIAEATATQYIESAKKLIADYEKAK
jgi:predicted flap endonuclease-1-like 5' DNA nuclease